MTILTLDIETEYWSDEVDGKFDNAEAFGIAVMVMRVSDGKRDDTYVYAPHVPQHTLPGGYRYINEGVDALIDEADVVVTFNGEAFDFRVMEGAGIDTAAATTKSFDIFTKLRDASGDWMGLDKLSAYVLGARKVLDGRKAVQFWRAGRCLLEAKWPDMRFQTPLTHSARISVSKACFDEVIRYCIDDVDKTYRLYQHIIDNNGWLEYKNKKGVIRKVNVQGGEEGD